MRGSRWKGIRRVRAYEYKVLHRNRAGYTELSWSKGRKDVEDIVQWDLDTPKLFQDFHNRAANFGCIFIQILLLISSNQQARGPSGRITHSTLFRSDKLIHLLPLPVIGCEVSYDGEKVALRDRSDIDILCEYCTQCDSAWQIRGELLICACPSACERNPSSPYTPRRIWLTLDTSSAMPSKP